MARTNGPIQVWHRTDTIPSDAEGGYAGGDSTAAAVGTALAAGAQASAQASAAIQLAMAAQTVNRDSPTGRLYYDIVTPPIFADDFNRGDESPVSPTPIGGKPLLPGAGTLVTTLAVTNGELAFTNTVSSISGPAYWNAGRVDGVFRVTVASQGIGSSAGSWDGAGSAVILRSSGPDWQDALIFDAQDPGDGATEWRLRERLGGAYGASTTTDVPARDGDVIEATMTGSRVVIAVNGATLIDGNYPSHTTGTHVGVMCNQRCYGVRYDDVSFEQIGA